MDSLPQLDGRAITDEVVVQRSHINNTAYNVDAFRDKLSLLEGYPEGRTIEVTYYSMGTAVTDSLSYVVNTPTDTLHSNHNSYVEIRNYELKCSSNFSYGYDDDTNVSGIESNAIIYPGMEPKIGDFFLYALANKKIGVFSVTKVARLALDVNTYHEVSFNLKCFLTPEMRDKIIKERIDIRYFDKVKYFVGNTSMLSTENYHYQNDFLRIKKEIIRKHIDTYYDATMDSFMHPDGYYDPYAVEFFRIKVSSMDYPSGYPLQLLMSMQNYRKTVWGLLTNSPIKDMRNVDKIPFLGSMIATYMSTDITSLLGRDYLMVGNEAAVFHAIPYHKRNTPINTILDNVQNHDRYRQEALKKQKEFTDKLAAKAAEINTLGMAQPLPDPNNPTHTPPPTVFPELDNQDPVIDVEEPPVPIEEITYVFSNHFYNGEVDRMVGMHGMERMIYETVSDREVNVRKIYDTVYDYMSWDTTEAFYCNLMALYLIDRALYWIRFHS